MPYPSKTDRQTILATAMDQVSRDGIHELSLRSVAAALGIAPNALYRYFADRAALQAALAEESIRRMQALLYKAAGRKSPEQAVRSIAQAYVRFAREEPQVFALTMMLSSTEDGSEAAHVELWRFVVGHVGSIYSEERAPEAAVTLWAFLHGMTALEAARVFGKKKPSSSFAFGLRMWMEAATVKNS